MNINKVLTKEYEKMLNGDLLQNEPKMKPNKPNFKRKKSIWEGKNIESQQIASLKNPHRFSVLFTTIISGWNGAYQKEVKYWGLTILLKIEQGLGLNHCYLFRISCESMDVQLTSSRFEVNIAKRLQTSDFQLRVLDKNTAVPREAVEVDIALPIQIRTHLLDLKIRHITQTLAQSAFVRAGAAELKTLNQAARGEHLAGCTNYLSHTRICRKDADNMSAAGNPDNRLIFGGSQSPTGINLEKLRMQRSLKKTERQFLNSYIDLWRLHSPKVPKHKLRRLT